MQILTLYQAKRGNFEAVQYKWQNFNQKSVNVKVITPGNL